MWTTEWPTERGWYWFYGQPCPGAVLCLTTCYSAVGGKLWTGGYYLDPCEAIGAFLPIDVPHIPDWLLDVLLQNEEVNK